MTTIFWGNEDGSLGAFDSLGNAKTGRWCAPPQVPDRCYECWDSETMLHREAEGYREETEDGQTWRLGVCHRCHPELCGKETDGYPSQESA